MNSYRIPPAQGPRWLPSPPVVVFAPLYLLLVGTGGMYHPQAIANLAEFSQTPVISVTGREPRKLRVTAQTFSKTRKALGLNMTEIAELFSVSRTAVYDWINGASPKPELVRQIELLASYADHVSRSGASSPSPIGRRILDDVRSGRSLESAISIRRASDHKEKKVLPRKLGFGNVAPDDSSFSEIVTPIILEQA